MRIFKLSGLAMPSLWPLEVIQMGPPAINHLILVMFGMVIHQPCRGSGASITRPRSGLCPGRACRCRCLAPRPWAKSLPHGPMSWTPRCDEHAVHEKHIGKWAIDNRPYSSSLLHIIVYTLIWLGIYNIAVYGIYVYTYS